ncbi:DUF5677 domain-containing protein [Bacillus haynesii]|uniref:DUF5677 domain-containing protein n=1 Tax=Bacillus haynesii TaxID=1925021 RepID=A0AA90J7M7_9BACI|nr:DUF5677 domain-containing protein [Bacillus haynesii]MCI4128218.1 DUF5677 domain-containing protein [Bacillus haynesii]MCY9280822.1 DUF5677 domain-containing protein [Bacillus haynesii]
MEFKDNYVFKHSIIEPFNFFVNNVYEPFYLKVIKEIESPNKTQKDALVLLSKTVNTLQAIMILVKNGNIVSARVLARSLFEVKLLTKKLLQEPETFRKYSTANDLFARLFSARQLKEQASNPNSQIEENLMSSIHKLIKHDEEINKIIREIESLGFTATYEGTKGMDNGKRHVNKYFEIKEMAQSCNEEFTYNTMYKNLCQDTHTSSTHFHRYFIKGESENVMFNLHPYLNESGLLLGIVMHFICDSAEDFCELLGINPDNDLCMQLSILHRYFLHRLPDFIRQGGLRLLGVSSPI